MDYAACIAHDPDVQRLDCIDADPEQAYSAAALSSGVSPQREGVTDQHWRAGGMAPLELEKT